MGKVLKTVSNFVLPNLGFVGGTANGLIQGQGLGGALKQGLGSAAQAAASIAAPGVGSYLGIGSGLAGAGLGALGGAANSALNGRNALTGAASGAVGGYLNNGGYGSIKSELGNVGSGIADTAIGRGVSDVYNSVGSGLGSVFGTAYDGTQGPTVSGAPLGSEGSGVTGFVTKNAGTLLGGPLGSSGSSGSLGSGLGSALGLGGGSGGGSSSYGSVGNLLSAGSLLSSLGGLGKVAATGAGTALSLSEQDKALKALTDSQNQAQGVLQPYLNSGTAANDKLSSLLGTNNDPATTQQILASSPGYQFQLDQGNQALDRQQAARGGYFSGSAIKAGQDYASGVANNTVNQYYNQLAQQAGQGQGAANSAGQIYSNIGGAKAAADINTGNIVNQGLGSLMGAGAYGRNPYIYPYA